MGRIAETRAFFGQRAAGWEDRFPDDEPLYRKAVAELEPKPGGVALDAACGTGRALPALRAEVGPSGKVLAVDVTPEMLGQVVEKGRALIASPILADVSALPLADDSVDAVFAAGLVSHLTDPVAGLAELRRVCRAGGRLALFHPVGRVALAARHGRELDPDDMRAEPSIRAIIAESGWRFLSIDDAADRYLVLAEQPG